MQALEAKLAAAEQVTFVRDNTMRLLDEQLKEKEGQVNKLQQDKNKLEVVLVLTSPPPNLARTHAHSTVCSNLFAPPSTSRLQRTV